MRKSRELSREEIVVAKLVCVQCGMRHRPVDRLWLEMSWTLGPMFFRQYRVTATTCTPEALLYIAVQPVRMTDFLLRSVYGLPFLVQGPASSLRHSFSNFPT